MLRELRLIRFRSYLEARLPLHAPLVALHGPNGAGKTNILEAVSMLSPGRGLRGATVEEMAALSPPVSGWRVAASLADGRSLDVRVDLREGARRQVMIDEQPVSQARLGEVWAMLWLTPQMDRLWLEGAAERRRFIDRAALSLFPDHGLHAAHYETALRERARVLRDMPRETAWLEALETRMAEAGLKLARGRALTVARLAAEQPPDDAKTLFPKAELAMVHGFGEALDEVIRPALTATAEAKIEAEAQDRFRLVLAQNRRSDAQAGRTASGPHRGDLLAVYAAKGMAARHCSTGEQKALLLSLVLANAKALRGGRPLVLLLDEVAAHLDEARRAALFEALLTLGVTAFMTGTGPELFAALDARAQLVAVSDSGGGSQLG